LIWRSPSTGADGGALRLETQGTLQPPDLATTVAISNLAIAPVQPYLGQHLNVTVHSGGLNVRHAPIQSRGHAADSIQGRRGHHEFFLVRHGRVSRTGRVGKSSDARH
jgi:hypothetical protein